MENEVLSFSLCISLHGENEHKENLGKDRTGFCSVFKVLGTESSDNFPAYGCAD
jgi:hypothetical protein